MSTCDKWTCKKVSKLAWRAVISSLLSSHSLNTPPLFHQASLWPALARLLLSVHPPTLVNTTCTGFRWSWTCLWCCVWVCLCVCMCERACRKETSLAVKSWNIRLTIGLCDVCLPGLSASACFDMCVWGLARFAGHDARLSWWICILAKRTDKGRDGGGTRRGVGWGAWMED